MGASGPNHASGNVPDPGASAGTTHFLREDATFQTAVTSVALTAPSIFTVAGSPITTSGTLALSLATQSANTIFAGPTTGAAATPTFRALATAALPAGTGTVTSAALTMPAEFTVTGSPITTNGTFTVTKANETIHTVFAGPSTGSPAVPTFRTLASTELSDTANIAYDNVANVFTANQTVTDIILTAATTATTATAGAQTLPASPAAFLVLSINAVNYKLPLYNT